jgi:hypothetical protein
MLEVRAYYRNEHMRSTFYNFVFKFPELTFHDLFNHLNIYINSNLKKQFMNVIILLTRTLYEPKNLSIKYYPICHCSRIGILFGLCVAFLGEILH